MEVLIIKVLLAHTIADFMLQPREVAKTKSRNLKSLSIHVGIYTLAIFSIMLFLSGFLNVWAILYWAWLNGILHFIVDYYSSKMSAYYYINGMEYQFWNVLGIDQFLHGSILLVTAIHFLT